MIYNKESHFHFSIILLTIIVSCDTISLPPSFSNFHKGLGNIKFDKMHSLTQYAMQEFFNQFPLLIDEIKRYQKSGATVLLQVESHQAYERLAKSLETYQCQLPLVSADAIVLRQAQIIIGHLAGGFYFADEKLVLITEHEIYHKRLKRRARRTNMSNAERLKDYNELSKGDYVVHSVHGIGRFLGIETINIQGTSRLCHHSVSAVRSNFFAC